MKTEIEIEKQKQNDKAFIISAVTMELYLLAYLEYFGTWENQGGMGWFFSECVDITEKIMFSEGSQYLKWLEHWKSNTDKTCEGFSEITGETCFDWYHMNEARKVFENSYEKDECTKEQVSEHIGLLINDFETEEERENVLTISLEFAKKERERKIELQKKQGVQKIIQDLKNMEVDGETTQYILEQIGMDSQMHRQLVMSTSRYNTEILLIEKKDLEN